MRYIIRAIEKRKPYVEEILKQIPDAEVYYDTSGNAMMSFLNACSMAGDDACVMLEDDIILTSNFKEKIEREISKDPSMLINFFSLSKKETEPHFNSWRQFCMNQCVYMPQFLCRACIDKYDAWVAYDKAKNPTAYDYLIGYVWHRDYLVYCPSLVQHIEGKSEINSRRSSKRQSITFKP